MNLGLDKFKCIAASIALKELAERVSSCDNKEIIAELMRIVRDFRTHSVFLISYDLASNDGRIKRKLCEQPQLGYREKLGSKNFPETTLIWIGKRNDTIKTALATFKKNVSAIIDEHDLNTDFDKTIVVEVMDQAAAIENAN